MHTRLAQIHLFQTDDNIFEMRPPPWLMLRALRKNQVSFLTDLAAAYRSITPGFFPCREDRIA